MKARIEAIIQKTGLTSSQFAKVVGIKQAALSHVLNGLNNPSLNLVMKIHQAYPNINLNWLFYGTGDMGSLESSPAPNSEDKASALFGDDEFQSAPSSGKDESSTANTGIVNGDGYEPAVVERVRYIERPPKKIVEMRIFYDDGTFETLIPKN